MARCGAAGEKFEPATATAKSYVRWEEVPISGDRGRRIVHYYLKDASGGSDLAVVGKERSARHMSYDVTPRFRGLISAYPSCSTSSGSSASARPRSRREVVDWLSSFVTDGAPYSSPVVVRHSDDDDSFFPNDPGTKGISSMKNSSSKDFSWIGSAWTCRKRRKHYRSYCRNGITISVHDFVVVMGEDYKRLVAYIEDLYEDIKGCNMTSVRWFHKVDEVGIPLPLDTDDREIFFTPCLQDLSVECIDGLTAVLSVQHFKRYLTQATSTTWEPYICRREIDNDDVRPFDITQVEGYWNQEFLKYMYKTSMKIRLKVSSLNKPDSADLAETFGGNSDYKLKRKHDLNKYSDEIETSNGNKLRRLDEGLGDIGKSARSCPIPSLPGKEAFKQKLQQQYCVGSKVEVLSQDSGIRGCWFEGTIVKKHFDKIKVRYQDLPDADDIGSLEEWLLLSRASVPDSLGIRIRGRSVVRPSPPPAMAVLPGFVVGSIVDVKWHDGWWEGIVISFESEYKIGVYFPGEDNRATFNAGELRFSKEWACNRWHSLKGRPELARRLCESHGTEDHSSIQQARPVLSEPNQHCQPTVCSETNRPNSSFISEPNVRDPDNVDQSLPNTTKPSRHHHIGRLKWTSHKKRSRRSPRQESSHDHSGGGSSSSGTDAEESSPVRFRFSLPNPLATEPDNCKLGGDPLFTPPLTITNLVVTR